MCAGHRAKASGAEQREIARVEVAAPGPASVRFADVSFRYRPGLPDIHQQVSIEVPDAGMTAIVGPSGAGKSTVFALIERFYEATGDRFCSTEGTYETGRCPTCDR